MTDLDNLHTIDFAVTDHVATVALDRPEKMNSFTEQMAGELAAVWARVRDDDDIRVAVLCANGDRAFCTGSMCPREPGGHTSRSSIRKIPGELLGPKAHRVWKPVIAALHGIVAGGAMYFVNECDFAICSETATFFDPHANAGIVSALEPMGMLALGVPYGEVMRWALLGSEERISAQTALRIGIVTEVVPDDQLRSRATELAGEIAARRPVGGSGHGPRHVGGPRPAARHRCTARQVLHRFGQRRRRADRLPRQQEGATHSMRRWSR